MRTLGKEYQGFSWELQPETDHPSHQINGKTPDGSLVVLPSLNDVEQLLVIDPVLGNDFLCLV